jgi:hypothetical protein
MFRQSELEAQAIKDYMAWQARDENVLHVEKVASERIFERDHDVWDVHTDKERWWVVTGPTNLYSQALMPRPGLHAVISHWVNGACRGPPRA